MKYQVIVLDLDGTLTNSKKRNNAPYKGRSGLKFNRMEKK